MFKSTHKLPIGRPQCFFRINTEMTSNLGDRKQQVPEFFVPFRTGLRRGQLGQLLANLCEHTIDVGPIEADARSAFAELLRSL